MSAWNPNIFNYQQKESPHSTEELDNGNLDKDIEEPIEEDSEINSGIINEFKT